MLGYNDSREVVLSWDRTTPREYLSPRKEQLDGGLTVLG